jgi:signal transduction histidine kinase
MEYTSEIKKLLQSLSFKLIASLVFVVTAALFALNLFTFGSPKEAVSVMIKNEMRSQARQLASSISAADSLDDFSLSGAVEMMGLNENYHVIVTDAYGYVLYDSEPGTKLSSAARSDIIVALGGEIAYTFDSVDEAFVYDLAIPITTGGLRTGIVSLSGADEARGQMFSLTITNLQKMSILVGMGCALAILVVSFSVTSRINELTQAVRSARYGNYEYRVTLDGNDEITRLGDEVNRLMSRLEQTEEARRRFVSDASHELKTPITNILLLSDSILNSSNMDGAMTREFLDDIKGEAMRLQFITEKLLDLTRMDIDRIPESLPVDMKLSAGNAARSLRPLAAQKDVSIRLEMPEESCTVLANEEDLYLTVFNLAENAVKYNRKGGSVCIRLENAETEVVLTVEDSGIGIPQSELKKIFSRFYRVDKDRSRATGGTGLGLSIVHDAVERFGGIVTVESSLHQGSRFMVRLPRYRAGEAGQDG